MMSIVAKSWRTGHLCAFGTMIVHVGVQIRDKGRLQVGILLFKVEF